MLKESEFWILTVAGVAAIAVAATNMVLFLGNRDLQKQASERAQYIQESIALEGLYREIAQDLANRAVRTRDEQVRDLLAVDGINVNFAADPAPQP